MSSEDILQQVAAEVAECENCDLHHARKNTVPGEGPVNAEIVFIGEGPGFHENEQGRPFVGAAGKFLEELLASIGMQREHVFIANVVKCRPPGNRDPQTEELAACSDYLERQIMTINPKVIATLGRFSMQRYLPNAKISQVHGQAVRVKGRLIYPMYHPAAALHQPSLKATVEADFEALPALILEAAKIPEHVEQTIQEPSEEPKQLSLF